MRGLQAKIPEEDIPKAFYGMWSCNFGELFYLNVSRKSKGVGKDTPVIWNLSPPMIHLAVHLEATTKGEES